MKNKLDSVEARLDRLYLKDGDSSVRREIYRKRREKLFEWVVETDTNPPSCLLSPRSLGMIGDIGNGRSFFQLLRDSEPEIQRSVDEMDEVGSSAHPSCPMVDTSCSV